MTILSDPLHIKARKEKTLEYLRVMQAYVNDVPIQLKSKHDGIWRDSTGVLAWDFEEFEYRIKPEKFYEFGQYWVSKVALSDLFALIDGHMHMNDRTPRHVYEMMGDIRDLLGEDK